MDPFFPLNWDIINVCPLSAMQLPWHSFYSGSKLTFVEEIRRKEKKIPILFLGIVWKGHSKKQSMDFNNCFWKRFTCTSAIKLLFIIILKYFSVKSTGKINPFFKTFAWSYHIKKFLTWSIPKFFKSRPSKVSWLGTSIVDTNHC